MEHVSDPYTSLAQVSAAKQPAVQGQIIIEPLFLSSNNSVLASAGTHTYVHMCLHLFLYLQFQHKRERCKRMTKKKIIQVNDPNLKGWH